jgi:hypothetical protein
MACSLSVICFRSLSVSLNSWSAIRDSAATSARLPFKSYARPASAQCGCQILPAALAFQPIALKQT